MHYKIVKLNGISQGIKKDAKGMVRDSEWYTIASVDDEGNETILEGEARYQNPDNPHPTKHTFNIGKKLTEDMVVHNTQNAYIGAKYYIQESKKKK